MRRITLWLLSTVSLLVLLFSYRTSTVGLPGTSTPAALPVPSVAQAPSTTPSTPSPTASAGAGDDPEGTGATPSPSPSAATPRAAATSQVAGTVVQTRWGPVQVAITVTGGKVTAVDVPIFPNGNFRDQEINQVALPTLVQETLDAQSAKIDMVSGATVTSTGYLESLQAALDSAHLG